jgi:hypothetical protein
MCPPTAQTPSIPPALSPETLSKSKKKIGKKAKTVKKAKPAKKAKKMKR